MSKFSLKKLTALVMALIMIMSVTVIGVSAEQKAAPLFTIDNINTRQGEEVEVAIKFAQDIKPAEINIAALDVSLHYNSEVFSVVQVVKGAGLTAAFDKLSDSTKLHLETGDYIFATSHKEDGCVNWCLSTIDGFTFAKDSDFAVVTFKAKDFSNLEGDLSMTLEVTNASTKDFKDTTALYTPVTNDVKVDINLATLCDWDFDEKTQTYTLAKFNDKNATYFTIPDEYDPDNEGPLPAFPVTKIKYGAFSTCTKLQNVYIGENIKTIDSAAFFNCTALKKVTVYSDDASFGSLAFLGSQKNLVIRCMKGSTADTFAKNNSIKTEYFEDISSCNFTGLSEKKYYTGTPVELSALKIYNTYGVALKEGKDYDVEYADNTELGTATIHVYGKGEYWGNKDLNFEILCPYHSAEYECYSEATAYEDCSKGGQTVRRCTFCGLNETVELPAKEHSEQVWETIEEPTCQKEGSKALVCPDCGVQFGEPEVLEKVPCNMEWVITKETTCEKIGEKGEKQYECTMCHKTEGDPVAIDCISHYKEVNGEKVVNEEAGEWIVSKEVTCTSDGKKDFICKYCGDILDTDVIPCEGSHLASAEWVVTKEATCTEDGEKQLLCVNCGEVIKTEIIKKTGHTAALETVVIEPTCKEAGEERTVCADCGEVLSTTPIPALGHEMSEWKVIKEVSCSEDGLEGVVCVHCGEVFESKRIESPGHVRTEDWVAIKPATCTSDGIEGIVCQYCGVEHVYERRVVKATGHDYGEWTIALAPTCTDEGFKQSTCSHCGDVKVEIVPATGHKQVYVADVLPTYNHTGIDKLVCEYCGRDYNKTRVSPKVVPDLDGSGTISSIDALMILQHSTELILLTGDPLKNADCNGDGKVNSIDALLVLQLATGIISA